MKGEILPFTVYRIFPISIKCNHFSVFTLINLLAIKIMGKNVKGCHEIVLFLCTRFRPMHNFVTNYRLMLLE